MHTDDTTIEQVTSETLTVEDLADEALDRIPGKEGLIGCGRCGPCVGPAKDPAA